MAYKTDELLQSGNTVIPSKSIEVNYHFMPSAITLMPNPANDVVYIETNVPSFYNIQITNGTGNIVYVNSIFIEKQFSISVAPLASGCYFVKVLGTQQTKCFKLIVNP